MTRDMLKFDISLDRAGFSLSASHSLPLSGITALIGSSASGKTTLLRAIAGLEKQAQGSVTIGDETWQDGLKFVPPHLRHLGYVFQAPTLFQHLSVAENINYGRRWMTEERQAKVPVEPLIETLELTTLMQRRVSGLSGGEQRRVALARALATGPRLMLLDEPLAGLDGARKDRLLPFLRRALSAADCPAIFVSHDRSESLALADREVLMKNGVISDAPALPPILRATVLGQTDDAIRFEFAGEAFSLPAVVAAPVLADGVICFRIDPQHALLTDQRPESSNALFSVEVTPTSTGVQIHGAADAPEMLLPADAIAGVRGTPCLSVRHIVLMPGDTA